MNKEKIIDRFYQQIVEDPRIRSSHICVFLSLISCIATEESYPIIFVNGELIERVSKLGKKTCLRCIRELASFGYLVYYPTNDARYKSRIIVEQ